MGVAEESWRLEYRKDALRSLKKKKKKREGNERPTPKNLYEFKIHVLCICKGKGDSTHIYPRTLASDVPVLPCN